MPYKDPEERRAKNHRARTTRTLAMQALQRQNRDTLTANYPCPEHREPVEERWQPVPIPDYATRYEVSDHGRIRRTRDGMPLKPYLHKTGYLMVSLTRQESKGNKIAKYRKVHTLVAKAFLVSDGTLFFGTTRESLTVNHKDGVKTNNHLENLELIPRYANSQDGWKRHPIRQTGTKGSKRYNAIVTEADIPVIDRLHAEGLSYATIAQRYQVNMSTIAAIIVRRSWRHVPQTIRRDS